jgi:hypothetical protein
VTPVRELSPSVPEPLEELVMRCLARQPRYRPSAAELARALAQRDPARQVTRPLVRPAVSRSSRRWAIALIAALLLASLGYTAVASRMAQPKKTITRVTTLTQPLQPPATATDASANARGLAEWLREHAG